MALGVACFLGACSSFRSFTDAGGPDVIPIPDAGDEDISDASAEPNDISDASREPSCDRGLGQGAPICLSADQGTVACDDAAADDGGSGMRLFDFDAESDAGASGWFATTGFEIVTDDRDPCNPSPGALAAPILYHLSETGRSQGAILGDALHGANWSGHTKLHLWLKLTEPQHNTDTLQVRLDGNDADGATQVVSASADAAPLHDRLWHQLTLDIAGLSFLPDVTYIAITFLGPSLPNTFPGPPSPWGDAGGPASIELDDVNVE